MQLRWTEEAANDLERIADYLIAHTPERAARLVRAVYDAPSALLTFPNRGRPGKKDGTRELVLSPLPYVVVYTVRDDVSTSSESCMARSNGREQPRRDDLRFSYEPLFALRRAAQYFFIRRLTTRRCAGVIGLRFGRRPPRFRVPADVLPRRKSGNALGFRRSRPEGPRAAFRRQGVHTL